MDMTDRSAAGGRIWEGAWLTLTVLAICVAAMVVALDFVPATTRYFPLMVSGACILFALVDITRRVIADRRGLARPVGETARDGAEAREQATEAGQLGPADAPAGRLLGYAGWFCGFVCGIWLLSLVLAAGIFVALFLRIEARSGWLGAAASGLAVVAIGIAAGHLLGLRWPSSLINPLGPLL